jgi:hypothetical protein
MHINIERSLPSNRAPAAPLSAGGQRPPLRPRSATLSRRELRRIIEELIG